MHILTRTNRKAFISEGRDPRVPLIAGLKRNGSGIMNTMENVETTALFTMAQSTLRRIE